ncbi:hypothetical protein GCM10022244_04450 [Streptomyces gulbargensis]|uniref:Uncharacterized protein n=1 Tax=Streptomyces gulbargensis TaxID=364901 RepID=A0ABP7LEB7_9ACTN
MSLVGPDGDRSGRSELDVVGVGGQDEGVLPVLGHTFQILAHEATVGRYPDAECSIVGCPFGDTGHIVMRPVPHLRYARLRAGKPVEKYRPKDREVDR